MADAAPYHCAFLINSPQAQLHMALAWRRVGSVDYGVYLTRRMGGEDASPLVTMFKATYARHGGLDGFWVKDSWCQAVSQWDENHARPGVARVTVGVVDASQLDALAESFFSQWLESYGDTEMSSMFRRWGVSTSADVYKAGRRLVSAGLPAEVQKVKLPDLLSRAEPKDGGMLFSFLPFPERVGETDPRDEILMAKMWSFFELL